MAPTKSNPVHPKPTKDSLLPNSTSIKKTSKPATRSKSVIDLDTHCGVLTKGTPCSKPLTCKIHSKVQKRDVVGRSLSYDMLVIPAWPAASPNPEIEGIESRRTRVEYPTDHEKRMEKPKPWTPLEREVAEDILKYNHSPQVRNRGVCERELAVARKIIEKIKEHDDKTFGGTM